MQPVAIVGLALRFPGVLDPFSFHALTLSGRRLSRLGYGPDQDGITPGHALAAEAAAAAIADARLDRGRAGSDLAGPGRTGIIVASCPSAVTVPAPLVPPIGAWVGQRLGLAGPLTSEQWLSPQEMAASAIGCSLRAMATACEALNRGEFDLMLAGGVAIGCGGDARDRDIRVYDAYPTGIAPGEGCGMVALVRAADARAAGLAAYAEIAGWSAAANGHDLRAVIRTAYLRAGIDPADVQLVEGHGAATATDDQAELAALLDVLDRADRPGAGSAGRDGARGGCALGSVAANLGDTQGAAGVAALLKTSLAMAATTIPPATGCVEPHELLRERDETLRLPRMAEEWPDIRVQLAAVNSLGAAAPSGAGRSGPTHLVLRRERDARLPGGRRRTTSVRGIPPQPAAARDPVPGPRSCPARQATAGPGRPGRVVLPRPRLPHELQRPAQPPGDGRPVPPPLPPAGTGRDDAAQAPGVADDAGLGARPETSDAGVAEALVTGAAGGALMTGTAGGALVTGAAGGALMTGTAGGAVVTGAADGAEAAGRTDATAEPPGASGRPPGQGTLTQTAPLPAEPTAPYLRLRQLLAQQSEAIIGRLTTARATVTEPPPGTGRPGVHEWSSGAGTVVALCARDRAELIARLEEMAVPSPGLASIVPPATGLTAGPVAAALPSSGTAADDGARAALVTGDRAELGALARRAVQVLRGSDPGPLRSWPQREGARQVAPRGRPVPPGVYLSEGARGQVALVFGGLAWTSAEHASTVTTSAATIEWTRRLGMDPRVAAGFGLGEIIGLAWAGAITRDEAAGLAALRAEILRPMGGLTAMARVHADRETTARLIAGTHLVRAVDEGPGCQVVAGPLPSVRALPHRAVELGVIVDLLNATCGLHSREMWPCVPPMAAIAAGISIGPLRRRLISSVTGIDFALSGAPADLLARQLERPALLASAISLASAEADLVLLATPDAALAEATASCCNVPVLLPPTDGGGDPAPDVLATLFLAGVVDGARLASGALAGSGRALVPEQAGGTYRAARPSRDRGASVTVG
ncbi:MAG TPA: acyltransferase domain-containing protein [Trebonia sp.]|nr:acyltransferase domain-containing protein [Trebonia sp.]